MTTPEDRHGSRAARETADLEALLREQGLLPVPLALVGRILDDVLPLEPVRPWVLVGRAAAAVLVFCASWLAFAGDVPAFADVTPEARVGAALGGAALPRPLPIDGAGPAVLGSAAAGPANGAALWLVLGAALLGAGTWTAWRAHRRAASAGGTR